MLNGKPTDFTQVVERLFLSCHQPTDGRLNVGAVCLKPVGYIGNI